jgi:hypothetical protein
MAKILLPPQTKHFNLSPYLFKERFYQKFSIRIILGNCSLPFEKYPLSMAIKQNKITCIKGFVTSTAPKFVFIIDMS